MNELTSSCAAVHGESLGEWVGGSGAERAASAVNTAAVVLPCISTPNPTCGERRKDPSPRGIVKT